MSGSKYDSGAEKRKRKRTHDDFMKSQQGSILKHLKRSTADEDLEEHMVIETANVQNTDDECRLSSGVFCQ